jgi:hypothetical protein
MAPVIAWLMSAQIPVDCGFGCDRSKLLEEFVQMVILSIPSLVLFKFTTATISDCGP